MNVVGQATSNGQTYSTPESRWAEVCFASQRAQIAERSCPAGTTQAVAGNEVLIRVGKPVASSAPSDQSAKSYPRSVVAIDASGQKLWLILVDGKQRLYSEGMTIAELTEWVLKLGVDSDLNLDGGGSVTLAVETPSGPKILNSPIQNKIPMNERPIANHLGFYAK